MSFRRNRPRLSAVPVTLLSAELRRRGFDVLPAGVWESTLRVVEARAEHAGSRDIPEPTELLREVGRIAGVEFPRAVEEIKALGAENRLLRAEANRSDREASALATALMLAEDED